MLGISTSPEFQYNGISPVPRSSANISKMFGLFAVIVVGLIVDLLDTEDGTEEGDTLGVDDGILNGSALGFSDSVELGFTDGKVLGADDGMVLGLPLGTNDGVEDGDVLDAEGRQVPHAALHV